MANEVLSRSLRPRKLSRLFGLEKLVSQIRNHVKKRPPRVWLFSGEPGCGKTTIARIMSVAYQCEHMELWGDPCDDCWKKRADFAIHNIDAAEHSGVEDAERLSGLSLRKPINGLKRIIVIDECHSLSPSAWKALLNPTEDTPEFTVWFLLTSELRKVPAANQRRPVKYALRTFGISETEAFLTKYAAKSQIKRDLAPLFEACHIMGVGSPGVLLQALDQYDAGASATDALIGTAGDTLDSFGLCKAVTAGNWPKVIGVLQKATPETSRLIRASVAGWIRGCLVREKSPKGQERAAVSLIELSTAPYEDALMLHWLYGVLWKITRRYSST